MTQKQQIQLLDSILPEIVKTNDPEGAMLKCAKKHNLAPAQLEKLAQVFNTTKTIVGLKKQANRGDSFSIVDVPSLVKQYTTYDPGAVLSQESKGIHAKVNKLVKSASFTGAFDFDERNKEEQLPNAFSIESEESSWATAVNRDLERGSSFSKQATKFADDIQDMRDVSVYRRVTGDLGLAVDTATQVAYDTHMDILEKCAAIMHRLTPDEGRWAECVRDIADNLGLEKAASVVKAVEDYFIEHRHHFRPADLVKDASADDCVFARDRHGVVDDAEEIADLIDINKQAKAQLAVYKKAAKNVDDDEDQKDKELQNGVSTVDALISGMSHPVVGAPSTNPAALVLDPSKNPVYSMVSSVKATRGALADSGESKYVDESKSKAESEAALQELMMSDSTISQADPGEVKALYSTISKIAPTVAKDPVMLGPVMKEALQYGSLPIQQVKDLMETEKLSVGNKVQLAKL